MWTFTKNLAFVGVRRLIHSQSRPIAITTVLFLLAASCSSPAVDSTGASISEMPTPTVEASPSEDALPTPTTVSEPAVTTRTVEHDLGATEVPILPSRIVVLNAGTILPVLQSLGVDVIGAPLPPNSEVTVLMSADDLIGVTSIGFPEISIEQIVLLEPDLILGFSNEDTEIYDQLSSIAPTVLVEFNLLDWKDTTQTLADVVGATEQAEEAIAQYEADVADLQAALGNPSAIEVSAVRVFATQLRLHTKYHFAGQVIDEVGLTRPPAQRTDDPSERAIRISLEQLELVDADVLFVFGAGSTGSAGADVDESLISLQEHPLWTTLEVAQSGRVHIVDPLAWQQGGLPAAQLILADLRDALLN